MAKRIAAIVLIFFCCTLAWAVLGGTIFARTYSSDTRARESVASTWGAPQTQRTPSAVSVHREARRTESRENGRTVARTVTERGETDLAVQRTRADVALDLEHRQKGLLWYSTYTVRFAADYDFRNDGRGDTVVFTLPLPTAEAIYDDLVITLDGRPLALTTHESEITARTTLPRGTVGRFHVGYKSQGLERWNYSFGENVSTVRDFELRMHTSFEDIDFPGNTISPTTKAREGDGWLLAWRYNNLVSGYQIGMEMPEKLQPGPLAGRISFFAPVSLLFFFLVLFILTTLRGIEIHPMNYFLLAAAFFAFHLLLAYLVDHVSIHVAFVIASLVSMILVATYLRLVVGWDFALRYAAPAQLLYLVLFSYAFFFAGYAGLTVTIGSIISLFAIMQLTGRVRWGELFLAKGGGVAAATR
ncbi:MAG TPA: inner membrane CreD family protein [Gemmatimonadaceae bacterium]|nr:inner membrane CreD family protein [Gemmatimonadaceae bacterium]